VPPKDSSVLAKAICTLLKNPTLREKYGKYAREGEKNSRQKLLTERKDVLQFVIQLARQKFISVPSNL